MVGWNNRCLHKATRGRTEDVHCVCLSSQLQKPHHHHRRTRSAVVSSDGGWILGFILVGIVAWYSSTADPTTGWMGGVWALSTSSSSLTYRASIWVTKPKGYNFDGRYDKSLPPHSALIIMTTRFRSVALNAQPLEDDTDKSESVSMDTSLDPVALSVARTQPPSETKNDNDGVNTEQDYPLNVPSPLLLAGSMLFGIASTGKDKRVLLVCLFVAQTCMTVNIPVRQSAHTKWFCCCCVANTRTKASRCGLLGNG